jgi:hypothetical protein
MRSFGAPASGRTGVDLLLTRLQTVLTRLRRGSHTDAGRGRTRVTVQRCMGRAGPTVVDGNPKKVTGGLYSGSTGAG